MPIQYSLIARGPIVLCSHQSFTTGSNFEMVMTNILPNIPTTVDAKTSYTTNNNLTIHVMVENGLIYLCASDSDMNKRQPFGFLNEVKRQFTFGSLGHRAQFAGEGELNRDFAPILASQMERYSRPEGGDQLSTVQAQVEEVKGVMTRNIEAVLERGQRLEDLLDKTTDLEANAATFQKTSRRVHRKMWWRNTRMTIIMVIVAIVVIGIIVLVILFSTGVLPVKGGGSSGSVSTTIAPSTITHH